ncbi:MAG: hypothetical protein IT303_00805 [Dehalococcoidia bacterium]|nr:hypothetical protein [Dehalococcoidia bacterium]
MTERRRVKVTDQGATIQPTIEPDITPEPEACGCPHLDPDDWDDVESDWSDITFLKTMTNAVMGVPVGYASAREDLAAKARALGATVPDDAMLLMGDGRFRRPLLLEVEDVPPGTKGIERPGGIAYTRIVPASYGELARVAEETALKATRRYGRKPDDTYVWYLTCRVCSTERNFETLIAAHYRRRPE